MMSLNSELFALEAAMANLKKAVRRAILRGIGVDVMVEKAFREGWAMHAESDTELCRAIVSMSPPGLDLIIEETRLWRGVDEAWENSNSEEVV